ncbi:MAG: 2-amino-4-hydroxy-6-hydroxymethyldihydropteridine diphosphokinase [Ignavibacteria bacterium]|jgi:2-amino-4-hydroxy-6-hydroxymethyldihydropteridine diphosphokinase
MVDASSRMEIAFSIGANLGNRQGALAHAINRLTDLIPDLICSSVYETEPVGYTDQPSFLNCACFGSTNLSIDDIHALIQEIHNELSRKSRPRWHEREIDVDLLIYGSQIVETETIVIPHPRMHQRAFVLKPLSEIAPSMMHPILKQSMLHLFNHCEDRASVEFHCTAEQLLLT